MKFACVMAGILFCDLVSGCFGRSPVERWDTDFTNEVQWVELRPFLIGARGETETIARSVYITNMQQICLLAREMSGSPYPTEVTGTHWLCRKWLQIDFHGRTNVIAFVIGIHNRYRVAKATEIGDFGWQGWRAGFDGSKSGVLPDLIDQIMTSNKIEWVLADKQYIGGTHYGIPAGPEPSGSLPESLRPAAP